MKDVPFTFGEEFESYAQHFVKVHPGPYTLPYGFKEELPKVYNFEPREDDVWVIGCPKSGTTWLSEIVWMVYHEGDTESAKVDHFQRYHFPEMKGYMYDMEAMLPDNKDKIPENFTKDHIQSATDAPSPRFLRSHLPLSLLPPDLLDTSKIVYIARDPKDCAVSFYHMFKDSPGLSDKDFTVQGMAEVFLTDKVMTGPYPLSVKEYWDKKFHKNMLFLFYEEIKLDLPAALRKVAKFLGKTLTDEQIEKLEDHLSIKTMKRNDAINMKQLKDMGAMKKENHFIRKGIIGDHKNYFNAETEKRFESWWKKYFDDPSYVIPHA